MPRPYLNWSIAQLEAEFDRAQDAGDVKALDVLARELQLRTTGRAQKLREQLEKFLGTGGGSPGPQARKPQANNNQSKASQTPNRRSSRHPPTDEQRDAIDQFLRGSTLKINAYAGTGKTSTLEMISNATPRQGQYIAFNRSIVAEAKERFPISVNCSTIHGIAFKAMSSAHKADATKMTKRINANELADALKLKRWQVDRNHVLVPRSQGYLVLETIRRFLHSADIEPKAEHVPRHGSMLSAPEQTLSAVTEFALHASRYVWSRMQSPGDPMPLGHDGYLKLWAMGKPQIAADFILLDEAQDTNPVVLDVLRRQSPQMVYVGDRYQQIYEWRGAVNAMEKIETNRSTYLTKSFRFGPEIARAASKVLSLMNESRPIIGNPTIQSRIGRVDPRAILARTNSSTITAVIEALDGGKHPHLIGGKSELMEMLKGVHDLKEGRQSAVPDFFGFDKWGQVVEFAKSGEGSHLLTFVNLVETRGERQLMWALNRTVELEKGDIIISTAHKAKGQEWESVRLMDDFFRSLPDAKQKIQGRRPIDLAELRLFYVALTRAQKAVEVPEAALRYLQ